MLETMARRSFLGGVTAVVTALLLASAGCEPTAQEVTVIQPAPPGVVPEEVVLNDANLVALMVTANNATIQRAQVARTQAASPQVRAFAEQVLEEHQVASQVIAQNVANLGITPQAETTSNQLEANTARTVAMMQAATGREVDRIYLESEIANRRWLIQTLDTVFIPMAPNGNVRGSLDDLREVLVSRLMEAEQLYEMTSRQLNNNHHRNNRNMQR